MNERKKTIFQTSLENIKIEKAIFRSTNVSSLQQMQISFPFNYNSDNLINVTLLLLQSVGLICTEIKIIKLSSQHLRFKALFYHIVNHSKIDNANFSKKLKNIFPFKTKKNSNDVMLMIISSLELCCQKKQLCNSDIFV